jgi:transcriptional regulator with XRE-family HTH domain
MSLATNIEYLMLSSGISQTELSRKTNIDRATITKILNGSTENPRLDTLEGIAEYFQVSIDQLLVDSDNKLNYHFHNNLASVLKYLMKINDITTITQLSNNSDVPISVLSDILNNKTNKPNNKTLQLLASYFNLTLSQLLGIEPLPDDAIPFSYDKENLVIPDVPMDCIETFIHNKKYKITKYLNIKANISLKNLYAVSIKDNLYAPDIHVNNTLLIVPDKCLEKGNLLVCRLNNRINSVYELISHNKLQTILRELGTKMQIIIPNENLEIFGTIVQIII